MAQPPRGTPGNIIDSVGMCFVAPIGTTEPTTNHADWPDGWLPVGLTTQGMTFTAGRTTQDIKAAEFKNPVGVRTLGQTGTVKLTMLEATLGRFIWAAGGGVGDMDDSLATYEPLEDGVEFMFGWDAQYDTLTTANARLIVRRLTADGDVSLSRDPANPISIPANFKMLQPADGTTKPYKWLTDAGGLLGAVLIS